MTRLTVQMSGDKSSARALLEREIQELNFKSREVHRTIRTIEHEERVTQVYDGPRRGGGRGGRGGGGGRESGGSDKRDSRGNARSSGGLAGRLNAVRGGDAEDDNNDDGRVSKRTRVEEPKVASAVVAPAVVEDGETDATEKENESTSSASSSSSSATAGSATAAGTGAAAAATSADGSTPAKKKFESRIPKVQPKDAQIAKRNRLFGASLLGTLRTARDKLKTDSESEKRKKQLELEAKIKDKLKEESVTIKAKLKAGFEFEKLKQNQSLEEIWKLQHEKLQQLLELDLVDHARTLSHHLRTTNKSVPVLFYRPAKHNASTEALLAGQSNAANELLKTAAGKAALITPESEAELLARTAEEKEIFSKYRAAAAAAGVTMPPAPTTASASSSSATAAAAKADDKPAAAAAAATEDDHHTSVSVVVTAKQPDPPTADEE